MTNTDFVHVCLVYNKALTVIRTTLQQETESGVYSDHLLNALACIAAVATFSGMFSTAVLHRDAMVKILTLRGNGDTLKGLQDTGQWTRKALQWFGSRSNTGTVFSYR